MSCDHRLIKTHLNDYLQGRLDEPVRQAYQQTLEGCQQCREVHEQGESMQKQSMYWQLQPVPAWHRTRFAVAPVRRSANWLGWSALLTSCTGILLVVFQLEISTANGLTISFGGHLRESRIQQLVDAQLEKFGKEQSTELVRQLDGYRETQATANRLQFAEWMDESRDERRQDMKYLMTSLETQRYLDRQRTDERLSYLARNQIQSDQYLNELVQTVQQPERGPL